jgi:hypothetical protein
VAADYQIVRQESGEWHLYRDGTLIDVEQDAERAPLVESFRWATAVAWAEDHSEVREWLRLSDGEMFRALR